MTYEENKKREADVARMREYGSAAVTAFNAKARAFLRKWGLIIILGVWLLLFLVWKGYVTVVSGGGGGGGP